MNKLKVSPFSCFPWTSKPEWSSRTWIYNKQIAYYVPSVLAILLLFIFLTSVVTYVCIRKFPTLIEGNARVVIVKKVREQPRVIESSVKENEGEVYFDTESLSQGYLTPRHHRYMQVKNRSTLHRSLSDGSCSRSTSSLSCTEADVRKVGTHRSERGRDLGRKVLEYKPPLPPPNNQQTVKNT